MGLTFFLFFLLEIFDAEVMIYRLGFTQRSGIA